MSATASGSGGDDGGGGDRDFNVNFKRKESGEVNLYQKHNVVFNRIMKDPETGENRAWDDHSVVQSDGIHHDIFRHRSGSITDFHFHIPNEEQGGGPGGIYHTTRDGTTIRARMPKRNPNETDVAKLRASKCTFKPK